MGALLLTVLAALAGGPLRDLALAPWAVLIVMAGADLGFSARRRHALAFDAPAEVFVGESFEMVLRDPGAQPRQEVRFEWPIGLGGPNQMQFSAVSPSTEGAEIVIPVEAQKRGIWTVDHLWLRWASPWRLFEFVPKIALGAVVRVVPNVRVVQSGALTTKVVSQLFGQKENRAIGDGSEFHQLRDFVPGMDVKTIDWKRSARKRALVAKELRAERNHHVILAIDNGFLMREEIAGMPKIDHAVTAALAVAWAANIGGDLVGHYAYDVRPRSFAKPEPGRAAFVRLRSWAAELDYVSRETNHTLALTELNARTPKRSLIIIFTDFIDTTSAELMLENISILAKRHLILFVTIRDPDLEAQISEPPDDMNGVATVVAANQSIAERRLVLERLARLGVTVIDAAPGQVTGRLISAYLDIKERELI